MSIDQAIKWAFIGLIGIVDLLLLTVCPLELDLSELVLPGLCGLFLLMMSLYYHHRSVEPLVVCMVTLLQMGCFTVVASVLIYAMTSFNFPLADPLLQRFDRFVGFSPQAIVEWTRSRPIIDHCSVWAYLFIVPETILTILAISFLNKRILLEQFMTQFMLGMGICAITACFLPAGGPAYNHGIAPADWQLPYIDHFVALRSGQTYRFSWTETEGLVTFPSFHTAWAIMLILVWRRQSLLLFVPVVVLSAMIILSTLTTASHYIVDVLGGIGLAVLCAWLSHRITAFAYHANGEPRRIILPIVEEFWLQTGLSRKLSQ